MPVPMKILFLFDCYFPYVGGAEVVNKHIAEHFSKSCDVTVCSKSYEGVLGQKDKVCGVDVYRFMNVFRLAHSFTCFLFALKKAWRSDLIFCATYASGLTGRWLAAVLNKKSVILVHEILGDNWKYFKKFHFLYYFYERWIVTQKFDRYIAVSRYTKKCLMDYGVPADKISVIYNGVEEEMFAPRPVNEALRKKYIGDAKQVYLFYGRPGGSKGLIYLIRAIPEISRSLPDSRLVLILAKEPQREYRKFLRLLAHYGVTDRVSVLSAVPRRELPELINTADVIVIPSLSEGFGFTAAESCALGKKIVATQTGSLPEVVHGRVVMVEKADPSALARGVIQAFRDELDAIPRKSFLWQESLKKYDQEIKKLVADE